MDSFRIRRTETSGFIPHEKNINRWIHSRIEAEVPLFGMPDHFIIQMDFPQKQFAKCNAKRMRNIFIKRLIKRLTNEGSQLIVQIYKPTLLRVAKGQEGTA